MVPTRTSLGQTQEQLAAQLAAAAIPGASAVNAAGQLATAVSTTCAGIDFTSAVCQLPFAGYFSCCQIPSVAQMVASDAGPAMTPANVAAATAAAQSDEQALCAQDPSGCASYNLATGSPDCAATFGAGIIGQLMCGDGTGLPWGLLIAGGAVLFLLFKK